MEILKISPDFSPPSFFSPLKHNSAQLITGDMESLIFVQSLLIKVANNGKKNKLNICHKWVSPGLCGLVG